MSDTKQIIITLNAKSLFDYFPQKPAENDQCFKLDFSDPVHSYVVTQEITREDCPLFHQIYEVLKKRQGSSFQVTEKTLYDKFLIVDFQDIFLSFDKSSDPKWKLKDQEFLQLFSFICMLSFDVYVKKQLIEKLIDQLPAS